MVENSVEKLDDEVRAVPEDAVEEAAALIPGDHHAYYAMTLGPELEKIHHPTAGNGSRPLGAGEKGANGETVMPVEPDSTDALSFVHGATNPRGEYEHLAMDGAAHTESKDGEVTLLTGLVAPGENGLRHTDPNST